MQTKESKPTGTPSGFFLFTVFAIACILLAFVATIVFGDKANALAGVSVGDYLISKGTIPMPTVVANKEIIWTPEMEKQRLEALKSIEVKEDKPKEEKQQEKPKEVEIDTSFDINKLAKAVAIAETGNCTKGYGKSYNNCFGIKNGNTAPCPKIGRNRMCIYEKPEDSYEAFKKIWEKWYKGHPNLKSAQRWTGNDNPARWLSHVNLHYNKD